jgi:hypothetical protein
MTADDPPSVSDDEQDTAYLDETVFHLPCVYNGCKKSLRSLATVYQKDSYRCTDEGL